MEQSQKELRDSLAKALSRIDELEQENKKLKDELAFYQNRGLSGRKKHNDQWQERLETFVKMYENGSTVMEIVEKTGMSRRTVYRYKEYYDGLKKSSK